RIRTICSRPAYRRLMPFFTLTVTVCNNSGLVEPLFPDRTDSYLKSNLVPVAFGFIALGPDHRLDGLGGRLDPRQIPAPGHQLHPESVLPVEGIGADGEVWMVVLDARQCRSDSALAQPGRDRDGMDHRAALQFRLDILQHGPHDHRYACHGVNIADPEARRGRDRILHQHAA